jgi:hypothetical protein
MPERVRADDVPLDPPGDGPVARPFVDALLAHLRGEHPGERRAVRADRIVIPGGGAAAPERVAALVAAFGGWGRARAGGRAAIPVWEAADGTLLAYGHAAEVAAYRRLAPGAAVEVDVLGRDAG